MVLMTCEASNLSIGNKFVPDSENSCGSGKSEYDKSSAKAMKFRSRKTNLGYELIEIIELQRSETSKPDPALFQIRNLKRKMEDSLPQCSLRVTSSKRLKVEEKEGKLKVHINRVQRRKCAPLLQCLSSCKDKKCNVSVKVAVCDWLDKEPLYDFVFKKGNTSEDHCVQQQLRGAQRRRLTIDRCATRPKSYAEVLRFIR